MVEKFSKEETSRLRTELSFELKTKVVGSFEIYNFYEKTFANSKQMFKRKSNLWD